MSRAAPLSQIVHSAVRLAPAPQAAIRPLARAPHPALLLSSERSVSLSTPRGPHLLVHEGARQSLERRLASMMREPLVVSITDNRRTMISSERRATLLRVRLHHMFLDSDDVTVRLLARYLKRQDAPASTLLGDYIERHRHRIRSGRRRPPTLRTRGMHHDLKELFDALCRRYFEGPLDVQVTWGRRSPVRPRRRRTSIRLGTYCAQDALVRIHPVLDQPWVPRFFVAYILFHELLHHVTPAPVVRGRQAFHGPEFCERERAYPDYARAIRWEQRHIRRLLASAA